VVLCAGSCLVRGVSPLRGGTPEEVPCLGPLARGAMSTSERGSPVSGSTGTAKTVTVKAS